MDRVSLPDFIRRLPDFLGRHIPLPLPVPDWSKPIILALLLLTAGFGVRAQLARRRARRLETEQRSLTARLDSMQLALVPEIPPRLGVLAVSVAYRPADGPAAGGDFYDAFVLDGERVAIILGDVSGHGRSALVQANRMRYTLRAYLEAGFGPRAALKLGGNVAPPADDDLFTTVAIAVHDPSAASLTYATAGHPSPLILGPTDHAPITSCASPALGWGAATGRRQTTVPFPKDARACFFSDGLTEARTGDDLLGRERLARMFADLPSPRSSPVLLKGVQDQAGELRDDMAACIIEATSGTAGWDGCTEELEVDLDQLAAGQAHRFLEACGVRANEIPPVIARARAVASEHGLAVLAVELAKSPTGSVVARASAEEVTPPVVKYGAISRFPVDVPTGSARPADARPVGASSVQ